MGSFKMKCTKCGQVVKSPPLGEKYPKGGNCTWTQASFNDNISSAIKSKTNFKKELELV